MGQKGNLKDDENVFCTEKNESTVYQNVQDAAEAYLEIHSTK